MSVRTFINEISTKYKSKVRGFRCNLIHFSIDIYAYREKLLNNSVLKLCLSKTQVNTQNYAA
jgi:hypothetical protein